MAREIFAGMIWGMIVAVPVVSVVSLLAEQPPSNTPPNVPDVTVPASAQAGNEGSEPTVSEATNEAAQQGTSTPNVATPDNAVSTPNIDTSSTGVPEASGVEGGLNAPGDSANMVSVDIEEPVFPNPQSLVPDVPSVETELSISTEPAQPPLPQVESGGAFDVVPEVDPNEEFEFVETSEDEGVGETAVMVEPETQTDAAMTSDAPVDPIDPNATLDVAQTPSEPAVAVVDDVQESVTQEMAEPEVIVETQETPTQEAETETESAAQEAIEDTAAQDNEIAEAVNEETPSQEPTEDASSQDPVEEEAAALVPEEPQAGLINLAPDIRVRRPGDTPEEPAKTVQDSDVPALTAYAVPFENPENKPLMSIILIDDGISSLGPSALSSFTYPVSVAIDPSRANASDLMRFYRDAGVEVIVLTNLPRGAQPSDLEVAFEAYAQAVPEAVAVLDGGENGFQEDRALVSQVTEILAANGQGLVTQAKGLNSVQRVAQEAGVASAIIFRDLDVAGQDARVIRRFLDQAAFQARQDGSVVLLGRLRPDTISALLLWGAANRAQQVALVPISGVLTKADSE